MKYLIFTTEINLCVLHGKVFVLPLGEGHSGSQGILIALLVECLASISALQVQVPLVMQEKNRITENIV